MATDDSTWTKSAVLKELCEQAGPSGTVKAQIFLTEDVAGDLANAVEHLVETAQRKAGERTVATIGKVHQLAKSFSIEATPNVLAAIADDPVVKAILPSEIADIYPKPV